jgi:hypothetical protein
VIEAVEEHREVLEDLAEMDLPASSLAESLIEASENQP